MKGFQQAVTASIITLLGVSTAFADATEPGDMDGAKQPNGKVAMSWVDTMFNKCDAKTAFEKYIDPKNYKNHPAAANGSSEVEMESKVVQDLCSKNVKFDFKKVVVQGDLVAIQVWVTRSDKPVGVVLTEWMRVKNGKIVDHWDMSREMRGEERAF